MITMSEVVKRVDALRPNIYPPETKWQWIANLEGLIAREVLDEDIPEYSLPGDADMPLLASAPFEDLYELYCMAMIDFANKEYDHYNNAVLLFKERYEQYKTWYIRRNSPSKAGNFRNVMG